MHQTIELNQAVVQANDYSSHQKITLKRVRSVRFIAEQNKLHEVEKADSQLRELYWVTRGEFKMMRERDNALCQLAELGKYEEDGDHSLRGLENRLKREEKPRTSAVRSVLREQHYQRRKGVECAVSLSLIYSRASQKARFDALRAGLHDADEASQYMRRRN